MNSKKLTKVQLDILICLRDNPDARISAHFGRYHLVFNDYRRPLRFNLWLAIQPYLKKVKSGSIAVSHYKLKDNVTL